MPEREFRFRITTDTSDAENKTRSLSSRARDVELNFYRITHLIEEMSRISKALFGVELPKGVRDAINELQNVIATLRTIQMLAKSTWAAVLGPAAAAFIVPELMSQAGLGAKSAANVPANFPVYMPHRHEEEKETA